MRWRLLFQEYGPGIVYTKGPKNVVADALSRLPKQDDIVHDVDAVFPFVPVDENVFPLQLKEIQSYQAKDRDLRQKIKNNPVHSQKETVEQVNIVTYTNTEYMFPSSYGQESSNGITITCIIQEKSGCTRPRHQPSIGKRWRMKLSNL